MATFVNPYGGGGSASKSTSSTKKKSYDVQELAKDNKVKKQDPFTFSKLVDLLNKPSEMTEGFLTGGSSYDRRLDEMGIQNTKGQLDLNDVLSTGGRLVADPLNLVAPLKIGKLGLKGAQIAGKVAGKVKPLAKAGRVAEDMFVAGAKTKRVSPQLYDEMRALETSTRAKQQQVVRDVGKTFKGTDAAIRDNLGKLVEKEAAGGILTQSEKEAVDKAKEFISKNISEPERRTGLLPEELAAYFPRKADKETMQGMNFGGTKGLSTLLGGAEKTRKYATQELGEEAGIVYKNALEALALRTRNSIAARANKEYMTKLIGGEVKDLDGNPLLIPMKKTDKLLDGYKSVVVDKSGMTVGDRVLKFYPTQNIKGKEIVGVTKRAANFQVPAEAAEAITKYYNTFTDDDSLMTVGKAWDKILGAWKGSVTSIFPSFHIRNAIGNLSNMWLGGFGDNPANLSKAVRSMVDSGVIQRGGKVVIGNETFDKNRLEVLGIAGKGQFGADIPEVLYNTLDPMKSTLSKWKNPLRLPSNVFEAGRNFGGGVEDTFRTAYFLDRVRKGDDIATAVKQTHKYLFDYSELSDAEKKIKRIIPFYTWARNNIPLQIEALIKNPGKQAAITKTWQNMFPLTDDEESALPPWFQETLSGKWAGEPGGEDFTSVSNMALPIEDLGVFGNVNTDPGRTLEREVLAQTGFAGSAIGTILNRDMFRGQSLDDPALPYSYGKEFATYPKPLRDSLAGFLKAREEENSSGGVSVWVDPKRFQILKSLAGRLMRTSGNLQASYTPGTFTDINIEEGKEKKAQSEEKELEKLLQEQGILKEFRKTYEPKTTEKRKSKLVSPF